MEKDMIPKIWRDRGVTDQQQVIDAINEAFSAKEKLGSNVFVGSSSCGNICIITDYRSGEISDAYPAGVDKDTFLKIKKELQDSVVDEQDTMQLEVTALAIAIDYMNYPDAFLNKEEVNGRYALFDSVVITGDNGDELLVISIEGLGSIALSYADIKSIFEKYRQ
ncbi:MAG: hypothetical protein ACSW8G_03785 [Bacillota bacterium]